MEATFLQKLAKEIHTKHPNQLDKLCFVFPSKRSGLFFKKELAKLKGESFWAPQILTIDTFIEELSGLAIINPLEQVFQLFEVHQELDIQPQLPFEKFIDSAKIILADFNDIDMAMADSNSLFQNVKDYVELKDWDPSKAGDESLTKKYLDAFIHLPLYYKAYHTKLLGQRKAYQGLVYKTLKERIDSTPEEAFESATQKFDMIYVAGLNALTKAEKWLFDWFANQQKLEVYFEAETQMIEDFDQESGKFIRTFAKEKGAGFKWAVNHLKDSKKNISTFAVNGHLSMARLVGEIFEENNQMGFTMPKGRDTAIILADENLLIPVLESLPKSIGDVNVTLGFPLGLTSYMSFTEQVFGMQRLVSVRNGERQFYFKDIMKVLTNPILVSIYGQNDAFDNLVKTIIKNNQVWISEHVLLEAFAMDSVFDELKLAFTDWRKKPLNAIQYFSRSIGLFRDRVEDSSINDDVLMEQMYFFKTSLIQLQSYIDQFKKEVSLEALIKLFKHVVAPMKVPFSGEPLSGIQIMGLLETRLLSFKNIVFISVNEGVIPAKGGAQSFLPFSLRKGFDIQTHQDRESLFAYHFYRVLSQAENINLIYDTSSEGVGSNEKSRFIRQIEQEWPEISEGIKFSENVGVFEEERDESDQSITKTPEVVANIKKYLTERGLSPSALNNFIESPIDFYYKNVIGVYESKSVDEEVEHNTFGTIVHNCLEEFYKPFEKQVLSVNKMKDAYKSLDLIIHEQFKKEIPNYSRGKHYLSFYSVKKYVKRFVKLDMKFVSEYEFPITLDKNELELKHEMVVDGINVKFKGFSDRVETRQGIKYIIDYKTGTVSKSDLIIKDFGNLFESDGKYKPKFVQLLMYAWLAHKQLGSESVVSGIYTLRDTELNLLKATIGKDSVLSKIHLEEFEIALSNVVKDMLDPELPLIPAVDYKFALFS